jgi:phosphoribosylaminoimidazole (AIR) synthetase
MTTQTSPIHAAIHDSFGGSVRVKTAAHITGEGADAGIARLADDGTIVVAWDTGTRTPADPADLVLA